MTAPLLSGARESSMLRGLPSSLDLRESLQLTEKPRCEREVQKVDRTQG